MFKSFTFLFVPSERSGAASLRSKKAKEYGANIVNISNINTLNVLKSITHILVTNKKYSYSDVIKYLLKKGLKTRKDFPNSIKVVNIDWMSDCIDKKSLIKLDKNNHDINFKYFINDVINKDININNSSNEKKNIPSNEKYLLSFLNLINNSHKDNNHEIKNDDNTENIKNKSNFDSNARIVMVFHLLAHFYRSLGDEWRANVYSRASSIINVQPNEIVTAKDAIKLPGIGQSLSHKIELITKYSPEKSPDEIVNDILNDKSDDDHNNDLIEKAKVLDHFKQILWVGTKTALKWYNDGCRTLKDIEKRDDLNPIQKLGLEKYDDFNKRIPREEVEKHFQFVSNAIKNYILKHYTQIEHEVNPPTKKLKTGKPKSDIKDEQIPQSEYEIQNNIYNGKGEIEIIINSSNNKTSSKEDYEKTTDSKEEKKICIWAMGSYLRGNKTCGDIDIILTGPGFERNELVEIRNSVLSELTQEKYIVASFRDIEGIDNIPIHSSHQLKEHKIKKTSVNAGTWMGAVALPDKKDAVWRRMDILIVPWEQRGAARIYYTGDDIFNRALRLLADKKGYILNQHGLFDASKYDGNEKGLIESASERKIFDILGVNYRPPTERNI